MPAFHHAGGDKGDEEAVCRHPSREAFVMECLSSSAQASPRTPRSWVKAHPPPALPGAGGGGGERSSAAKAAQILKLVGLGVVLAIGVLFVLELMLFMAVSSCGRAGPGREGWRTDSTQRCSCTRS